MVFGKSKEDKQQDKSIKQLWVYVQQHAKDIGNCWAWIQKLHKDNQSQDSFDKQVIESLRAQDAKIGNTLELAKRVQTLEKTLAALQAASHTHQAVKEP